MIVFFILLNEMTGFACKSRFVFDLFVCVFVFLKQFWTSTTGFITASSFYSKSDIHSQHFSVELNSRFKLHDVQNLFSQSPTLFENYSCLGIYSHNM